MGFIRIYDGIPSWDKTLLIIYITGYSWNKDIFIYPEGSYIHKEINTAI